MSGQPKTILSIEQRDGTLFPHSLASALFSQLGQASRSIEFEYKLRHAAVSGSSGACCLLTGWSRDLLYSRGTQSSVTGGRQRHYHRSLSYAQHSELIYIQHEPARLCNSLHTRPRSDGRLLRSQHSLSFGMADAILRKGWHGKFNSFEKLTDHFGLASRQ